MIYDPGGRFSQYGKNRQAYAAGVASKPYEYSRLDRTEPAPDVPYYTGLGPSQKQGAPLWWDVEQQYKAQAPMRSARDARLAEWRKRREQQLIEAAERNAPRLNEQEQADLRQSLIARGFAPSGQFAQASEQAVLQSRPGYESPEAIRERYLSTMRFLPNGR